LGFDLHGKTVGVIGTGKIGAVFAKIMLGFGCRVLAFDLLENEDCKTLGVSYVVMNELLSQSDIISLHCPLTSHTKHIIDEKAITIMKDGVMLINTGRGQLVNTKAIINALKKQKIGSLGLDVYEEEENLFFRDLSDTIIQDDLFLRLQTFPNVIITGQR
jgi:D-lactate dehydrogenase